MGSLYDKHKEIVRQLQDRGEEIYNPLQDSFLTNDRIPDVYVKGRIFPSHEFICGNAVQTSDGAIGIFHDFGAYQHYGFSLDELGLCDPILWYRSKPNKDETEKNICPLCGKER